MAREYLFDTKPEPVSIVRGPQPWRPRLIGLSDSPQTGPDADRLIAEAQKDKVRSVTRRASRPAHGRFFLPGYQKSQQDQSRGLRGTSNTRAATRRAPVGVRPNHSYLTAVMTSSLWVPALFGEVRLSVTPESVDLHRLESGLLSAPQDHDTRLPFGRWTEATVAGGQLIGVAEIGRFKRAVEIEEEIAQGVRHGFSIGFIINETTLIDREHPDYVPDRPRIEITDFFPYECSSVSAPMIPDAVLKDLKRRRKR